MVAKSIAKMYTNIHKPTDYNVRGDSAGNGRRLSTTAKGLSHKW